MINARGVDFNLHIESVKSALFINAYFVGNSLALTKLFAGLMGNLQGLNKHFDEQQVHRVEPIAPASHRWHRPMLDPQ